MRCTEFLDTAERLSQQATEGDWRSAISRGYYAVFHCFREFLLVNGVNLGLSAQSHFNLYTALLNCGFPAVAKLGSRVDDLRRARVGSDYDLGQPIHQASSLRYVKEARAVVADFQALLANLSPTQIAAGAKRHLQTIGRIKPGP